MSANLKQFLVYGSLESVPHSEKVLDYFLKTSISNSFAMTDRFETVSNQIRFSDIFYFMMWEPLDGVHQEVLFKKWMLWMKFGRKYNWFYIIQIFNVIKKLRCILVVVNRFRMFQIDEHCWQTNFETCVSECLKGCLNLANALSLEYCLLFSDGANIWVWVLEESNIW